MKFLVSPYSNYVTITHPNLSSIYKPPDQTWNIPSLHTIFKKQTDKIMSELV